MKGCLVVPVILILVVIGGVALSGCASWDQAKADRARAEAALVDARAAAEHQRSVDAESRYMLHTATLAAFLGSRSILDQLCAGTVVAAVVVCCVALSYWVFKRLDW